MLWHQGYKSLEELPRTPGDTQRKKQFSHSALCGSNQSFCSLDPPHLSFLTFTLYDILFYLQELARAWCLGTCWNYSNWPTQSLLTQSWLFPSREVTVKVSLLLDSSLQSDKCLLLCELSLPSFMNNYKSYVWEHKSTLRLTFQSFSEWSLEQHSNSEENHRGASCFCCRVN